MGLCENLGGGPLFSCFIAFLFYNFSKSFEGVHEVPPPPPLCASMNVNCVVVACSNFPLVKWKWNDDLFIII